MTLIKDLIEIPELVNKGDFVLSLADGVNHAEKTLGEYVVTPELTVCFDHALAFIHSALQSRTSKASYLHGSFGSGKSHFMAVLHLILQGNTLARGIPELAPVISKHHDWIGGKKFLLVPYHMIGSNDMESGILGGYVDFMRRTHPEAPIPGVYLAEGLFRDAENLRLEMGDASFFEVLNKEEAKKKSAARQEQEPETLDGAWGDVDYAWDLARFQEAVAAKPGQEPRPQLISVLASTFFRSYDMQASGKGEAFVSLDTGLSILSRHASSLGYDGLILFLDELVLWLASRAADLKFVHQEGQKLSKLVEAQTPDRPIPIISFVARQRDLSELIGDSVPGADRLNFGDALKHWEGRFHKITLEDRNLPAIAQRRVLKPKSESARQELDAAFEKTRAIRESVLNILLTREGDRAMFRKIYPFSPALVQTLIAVSSVLQRERTALKVMMELLSLHRQTLKVGDLVPVGDLFDVVAQGDEAFSQEMAIHFGNARRLYNQKLLPVLEKQHGPREEIQKLPYDDLKHAAFRNDDRLIKTLLLSALVPEVEALRALNAERLAALNHGTIKTPIPGREGQEVLRRCRTWAASVGELRIGEDANPTISVQLSGVDTEGIIRQAAREDNHGNRVRRVRQMIFEQANVKGEGEIEQYVEFDWKGTRRTCSVLFKNIRELSDASLENRDEAWKLIIDFPFDEPGHGPKDDLGKLQGFKESHPEGAKTLCWVPAFFSDDAQKDLGLLVILDHILAGVTGERFAQYSAHLAPQDRQSARSVLESQRNVLQQRVRSHLDAAYGLDALLPGSLDTTRDLELGERFVSLLPGFDPAPPVAATLEGAMYHLLAQSLDHEYPAAPAFEAEVKLGNLKKVYEVVSEAARNGDGRVAVDKPLRPLIRSIANPLKLGEMVLDATHFVIGQHWKQHFTRKAAESGTAIEVRQLRKWIDEPKPMGLPREAANLVILIFALQTNRSFFLHNSAVEPSLSHIDPLCELREQRLPAQATWETSLHRAGTIFGIAGSPLRNASNVAALSGAIKRKAGELRGPAQNYCQRLRDRLGALELGVEGDRLTTATALLRLLEGIHQSDETRVIDVLASAEVATSESAMGQCASLCGTLVGVLDGTNWEIFEAIARLTDDRARAALAIRVAVAEALGCDEHVRPLGATLKDAQSKAVRLLSVVKPLPPPPPPLPPPPPPPPGPPVVVVAPPPPPPPPGITVVDQGSESFDATAPVEARLVQLKKQLSEGRTLQVTISWRIEEESKAS